MTPVAERPSLTDRQQRILDFVRDACRGQGFPPTVREIAAGVDLKSPSTVARQLGELERKGYLRRASDLPRAIALADPETCVHCGGTGKAVNGRG